NWTASSNPETFTRCLATASDFSVRSTAVTRAPCRAKLMVSVPIPHPISSTFLPLHRSKSAKPGICDSTKYLRASTSSEYSFVPTGLGEWRMLQGRESQYSLTFWIEVFSNDILNYSVLAENSGVTRPFECESSLPDLAALARPPAPTPAPPY